VRATKMRPKGPQPTSAPTDPFPHLVAAENEVPLLTLEDLAIRFEQSGATIRAVDGISLRIPRGRCVALVGESGSGKSVTARAIMRLLPEPPAVVSGTVTFEGVDVLSLPPRRMRAFRGGSVGLVFQDPGAALNPVYSVGYQVAEALGLHGVGFRHRKERAVELLTRVGFPEPERRYGAYPHEMSGGMQQRVMIAIALAGDPDLLIADEPTTALDMLAAAQINALLADLQRERDMSLLLISHDMGQVSQNADHIVVLYAGRVMESGAASLVLNAPQHPYTQGLLGSVPPLRHRRRRRRKTPTRLPVITGQVPDPEQLTAAGCRFAPRCPDAFERCFDAEPALYEVDGGEARCFLVEDGSRAIELGPARTSKPRAEGETKVSTYPLPAPYPDPTEPVDDDGDSLYQSPPPAPAEAPASESASEPNPEPAEEERT